jgi:hypothetical protein
MDTQAPFEFFAKNGFYVVGNKIFNHKIHALQEASRTGQSVHWNFNDEVFAKVDWTHRLNLPLLEMYRMRAQQLRQKYQYLIACWSGGGDSTTMLDSFLNNNIHLDELLILWPTSLSPGKYVPSLNKSPENFMSEWDYSIKPRLEKLQIQYPKLQITIRDTFKSPPRDEHRDDTVLIVEKHSYGTIQKWRELDHVLQERSAQYHNVAAMLAVSPVDISILDNHAVISFDDVAAYPGSKSDFTLDGMPRNIEFFYWSPDFPELVREQAHAIIDQLELNPNTRNFIANYKMNTDRSLQKTVQPDGELTRQFLKSILYPNYPLDTFQARKQNDTHYRGSWETWFHGNPHSEEFLVAWESAIASHQALIADRFCVKANDKIVRYQRFQTRWYPIARLKSLTEAGLAPALTSFQRDNNDLPTVSIYG